MDKPTLTDGIYVPTMDLHDPAEPGFLNNTAAFAAAMNSVLTGTSDASQWQGVAFDNYQLYVDAMEALQASDRLADIISQHVDTLMWPMNAHGFSVQTQTEGLTRTESVIGQQSWQYSTLVTDETQEPVWWMVWKLQFSYAAAAVQYRLEVTVEDVATEGERFRRSYLGPTRLFPLQDQPGILADNIVSHVRRFPEVAQFSSIPTDLLSLSIP